MPYTCGICNRGVHQVYNNPIPARPVPSDIQPNIIAESQCRELGNLNTSMPTNKTSILLLYTAQFMDQFRTPFPDCSIPIKMHLVEEHTVVWARQTHVGFGLMGEQGAKSIMPDSTPCKERSIRCQTLCNV